MLVPSHAGMDHAFQANAAYKTYTGKLSILRTYYVDANLHLAAKEKQLQGENRHVVGLGFYSDREGDYFNKNRGLARYAVHVPLQENLYLSGGAALHLINFHFHASGSGATGSDMAWSGAVSSSLYSPTFRLGISVNDINSPAIQPIRYDFTITRFLTVVGEKTWAASENTQVKASGRGNFKMARSGNSSYIFQLGLVFSKMVALSGFVYVHKGWGMAFDLYGVQLSKHSLDFSLAYQIPNRNVYPAVSQYELNIGYYIKRD